MFPSVRQGKRPLRPGFKGVDFLPQVRERADISGVSPFFSLFLSSVILSADGDPPVIVVSSAFALIGS